MHIIEQSPVIIAINEFIEKRISDNRLSWLYQKDMIHLQDLSSCEVTRIVQEDIEEEHLYLYNTIIDLTLNSQNQSSEYVTIHIIQGYFDIFLEGSYYFLLDNSEHDYMIVDDCKSPDVTIFLENMRTLFKPESEEDKYEFFDLLEQLGYTL